MLFTTCLKASTPVKFFFTRLLQFDKECSPPLSFSQIAVTPKNRQKSDAVAPDQSFCSNNDD